MEDRTMEEQQMNQRTLYRELTDLAGRDPQAAQFIEPTADGHLTTDRAGFVARVDRIAAMLAAHGVGPGACVATWLPNWVEAYAWQFAASAVGAHVVGINTRYNVAEVAHVLGRARPRVVAVAHGFQRLDLIERARGALAGHPGLPAPAMVPVPVPGAARPGPGDLAGCDLGGGVWSLPEAPDPVSPVPAEAGRLGVAFTTSGSTGMPKLAAHAESAVVAHARACAERIGLGESDVLIAALPFSGVFGFSASMAALAAGATLLLHPVFDERQLVRDIERFGGSHYVGADDMLSRIAAAWRETGADLSSLAWMGIADFQGQSRDLAAWAAREFGTTTVGVYGSSEVFALAGFWRPDTDEDRRYGAGGYPASAAIEVRVAEPFTGEALPPGEEGEVQFRGYNVVDAYLGDDGSQRAAAFTDDGWFATGDLGTLTGDGGFIYGCRMGDVLRLKGFMVHPAEIEQRLAAHPGVDTAKVVGLKADNGEDQAVAFVTRADGDAGAVGLDGEELREWCRRDLARYKVPAVVHVIDQMPTTSGTNGTKIRAATLRDWARERALGSAPTRPPAGNPATTTPASSKEYAK
jgi:acyl-CoA synthetase (AMP-forming)/AMP-acid ligase II